MFRTTIAAFLVIVGSQATAQSVDTPALWDGRYYGFDLGYASHGRDEVGIQPPLAVFGNLDNEGAYLRLRIGQNWQTGRGVFGLEGESTFGSIADSLATGGYAASSEQNIGLAMRFRYGQTTANGRGLGYAALGFDLGQFDYMAVGGDADIDTQFRTAGASGALGWEQAIDDNWSWRAEYRYTIFKSKVVGDGTFTTKATPIYQSLQLGLSRKF